MGDWGLSAVRAKVIRNGYREAEGRGVDKGTGGLIA